MQEKIPTTLGPVGVVGLGNMGGAMAANLIKAGFDVVGADLLEQYRDALILAGGKAVPDARTVGESCRYIILSLPSEGALNAVCNDLAASCKAGTIVLETGTLPIPAKEKAKDLLAEKGVILLDTALSGTGAQAKNKDLVVLASGDSQAIEKVIPIIKGFARSYYNLGEFGNGMKMKFVANQLVAIHNVATAEAILLGSRLGLDPTTVVDVIGDGAGSSRIFQVRGPSMVNRTWDQATVTNTVFLKDLKLITEALQSVSSPSPLFSASIPIYTAAMASGHADHDTAAVFEVLERMTKAAEDPSN